ncbi:lipid-A-disaccharide synthase [Parafilimonas sp.]|uniref:lipid-A-disaccharide synthase n=1 Tax=Parafilimonas sp. TaxID=1969739 RepID=UPI003F823E50
MKYYIIAGEASGDLHGSNLIKEIKKLDEAPNIRCWGGDLMQAAGATLVKHYRDLAFMGFAEVVMNLKTILNNLKFCKEDILEFKPDVLVLIDYPGFNLRIAEWAHQLKAQGSRLKAKIVFYISPQVWAWKESRVPKMKETIDEMIVILPFEKEYYKSKWNWDVDYVGHPLVQVVDEFKQSVTGRQPSANNIIAMLPGSRKQEIAKKLPIMLEVSRHFPQYQFILAKAPGLEDAFYESFVRNYTNVSSVRNKTYQLLTEAKAALVTSGTATLETALFGVPEVVCYKGSNISYQIAKRLIKIKYIALVNLIMDKPVVKELIQNELTVKSLKQELSKLLFDEAKKEQLKDDYENLKNILSADGNASANAAKIVVDAAKSKN